MKMLIFAVLLTIVQAAPPVPGKTPDKAAARRQNVQANANAEQQPSSTPTVKQFPAASGDKQERSKPSGDNAPKPIQIGELPPVSVTKDRWDTAYIAFTGLLVFIGGLTLIAIWYQAIQTRRAAMRQETALVK